MRKSTADVASHDDLGKNSRKLHKVEGLADIATLGFIVVLGLLMVIGLVTASGNVTW